MQPNPFAPPLTEVADVPPAGTADAPYFAVSLWKLAVLSTCTFGLYELFWFYRQWRCVKQREASTLWPFWRAFFTVIFCYSLFRRIRESEVASKLEPLLAAGPLALGWIGFTVMWKLPDPYWLLTYLAMFFLLPVQAHVNSINAAVAPTADRNARFTPWNWVAIILGGLLFAMAIVGAFLPDEPGGT